MLTKFKYWSIGIVTALAFSAATVAALSVQLPSTIGGEGTILKVSGGVLTFGTDLTGGSGSVANGTPGFITRYTSTSTITTGVSLDNGTVSGVNATSSTVSFNVQGTTTLNPFNVSSSTGTSLFFVGKDGKVGIATTTPSNQLTIQGTADIVGASGSKGYRFRTTRSDLDFDSAGANLVMSVFSGAGYTGTQRSYLTFGAGSDFVTALKYWEWKNSSGAIKIIVDPTSSTNNLTVNGNSYFNGRVGIGSSSPNSIAVVTGSSTQPTIPVFTVASSTNASMFQVGYNGSTTLSSLGTGVVLSTGGSLYNTSVLPVSMGGTGTTTSQSIVLANLSLSSSNLSFSAGDGSQVIVGTNTTISLTNTPTFTTMNVTATTTLAAATTTIKGVNYFWPSSQASGTKILQNDGSGNLSWATDQTGAGGSLSGGTTGFVATWASSTGLTVGTLKDNGTVAGVNATSSSYSFNVQGASGVSPFNVASSTTTSMFNIDQSGNMTSTGSLTLPSQINFNSAVFTQFQATVAGVNLNFKTIAGAGDIVFTPNAIDTFWINDNQSVGINTSTTTSTLYLQGKSTHANILNIASSTGVSLLTVTPQGTLAINTTTPVTTYKLYVAGTSFLSGGATVPNDTTLIFGGGAFNSNSFKTGTDGTFLFDIGASNSIKIKGGDNAGANFLCYTDTSFNCKWSAFSDGKMTVTGTSTMATTTITRLGVGTTTPGSSLTVVGTLEIPQVTVVATLNRAGQLAVNTTSGSLTYHDGTTQKYLNDEVELFKFYIENPAANEKLAQYIANATSTITKIYCVNTKGSSDSANINLVWSATANVATSSATSRAFTSFSSCNGTTTPSSLSLTGSTTINTLQTLHFITSTASSSGMFIQAYGRYNQ